MAVSGTADILARLPAGDTRIEVKDFRLVTLDDDPHRTVRASESRTEADYVRFDLAGDSLLEPITSDEAPFRVTMYDPRALDETHRRGRHRYLVARELIEADVVFNVPKLKTHKKSGVTGALKNLVGINGHKAYLPHHRKGGAGRAATRIPADRCGRRSPRKPTTPPIASPAAAPRRRCSDRRRCSSAPARAPRRLPASKARGTATTPSGACRSTCSGCSATAASTARWATHPAREIVTVTDAIIAGEGEGPLALDAVPARPAHARRQSRRRRVDPRRPHGLRSAPHPDRGARLRSLPLPARAVRARATSSSAAAARRSPSTPRAAPSANTSRRRAAGAATASSPPHPRMTCPRTRS